MTPPEAQDPRSDAGDKRPPAVSFSSVGGTAGADPGADATTSHLSLQPQTTPKLTVIAKRADFLRAASARRQSMPGFLLQARARNDASAGIRIGYTCSKKIGNAVARNRAKRRLREVARAILPGLGRAGWDYVLVGRPGATIERDFAALLTDLAAGLARIHGDGPTDKARK